MRPSGEHDAFRPIADLRYWHSECLVSALTLDLSYRADLRAHHAKKLLTRILSATSKKSGGSFHSAMQN